MTTRAVFLVLLCAFLWRGSPTTIAPSALMSMMNDTQIDPASVSSGGEMSAVTRYIWVVSGYPWPLLFSGIAGSNTGHPLHFWIAHTVGAITLDAYVYWCIWLVMLAYGVAWGLARHYYGVHLGNLAFGLFMSSPIAYVLLSSIGLEDALTVLFTAGLLWGRHPILLWACGFLGAVNHPIGALAGGMILGLRHLSGWRVGWGGCLGLVSGVGFSLFFLVHYSGRWEFFHRIDGMLLWHHHLVYWPLLLYSFGFGLWVPALTAGRWWWKEERWYAIAVGVYLVGCWMMTIGMLDPTRVFALLTWPVLLHGLMGAYGAAMEGTPQHSLYPMRRQIEVVARWGWLLPALGIWSGKLQAQNWDDWWSWISPIGSGPLP